MNTFAKHIFNGQFTRQFLPKPIYALKCYHIKFAPCCLAGGIGLMKVIELVRTEFSSEICPKCHKNSVSTTLEIDSR